jgi:hypothetical protein
MRTACLVQDFFDRQLKKRFLELATAKTLAQRVASAWAVRQHVEYMVHIGDGTKAGMLHECDRLIDKALRVLIRVDPEGFDMLEAAVNLAPQRACWI